MTIWYGCSVLFSGVDPKSILCEHFKVGQCAKGFKCKFSHDLNIQRKGEKIDIYSDKRDGGWYSRVYQLLGTLNFKSFLLYSEFFAFYFKEEGQETMEDWDQEKLEKVVASKSNEYNKNKPTDIVSLFITLLIL